MIVNGYHIKPGTDLSGADLSRADLSGADLSGADLSGADLYAAKLLGSCRLSPAANGRRGRGIPATRRNLVLGSATNEEKRR